MPTPFYELSTLSTAYYHHKKYFKGFKKRNIIIMFCGKLLMSTEDSHDN